MGQSESKTSILSAFRNHKDREDLPGEHPSGDTVQLILLFLFLSVWITDSFFLRFSTFLCSWIGLAVRIPAAVLLLACWVYMSIKGLTTVFGTVRETPHVIDTGIFKIVRHPIYLASILFYLGLFALTLSLLSGSLIPFIAAYYHFLARYEERLLISRFGEAYMDYMKDVPMWIPRIGGKRAPAEKAGAAQNLRK